MGSKTRECLEGLRGIFRIPIKTTYIMMDKIINICKVFIFLFSFLKTPINPIILTQMQKHALTWLIGASRRVFDKRK